MVVALELCSHIFVFLVAPQSFSFHALEIRKNQFRQIAAGIFRQETDAQNWPTGRRAIHGWRSAVFGRFRDAKTFRRPALCSAQTFPANLQSPLSLCWSRKIKRSGHPRRKSVDQSLQAPVRIWCSRILKWLRARCPRSNQGGGSTRQPIAGGHSKPRLSRSDNSWRSGRGLSACEYCLCCKAGRNTPGRNGRKSCAHPSGSRDKKHHQPGGVGDVEQNLNTRGAPIWTNTRPDDPACFPPGRAR